MNYDELLENAAKARERAYAPYSNFAVGAAVMSKDGKIYSSCNVENAAYGLTVCAETSAILKAVSEGERSFVAVAVIADAEGVCRPCGSCRQVIAEFGLEIEVVMANLSGEKEVKKIIELLPLPFIL